MSSQNEFRLYPPGPIAVFRPHLRDAMVGDILDVQDLFGGRYQYVRITRIDPGHEVWVVALPWHEAARCWVRAFWRSVTGRPRTEADT